MCYNCGEIGHLSWNCMHKQAGAKCFKCNEFGHISKNCPKSGIRGIAEHKTNQSEKPNRTTSTSQVMCVGSGINRVYKTIKIGDKSIVSRVDTASDYHLMRVDQYLELGSLNYDPKTEVLNGPKNVKIHTIGQCKVDSVVDEILYTLTYHIINVDEIPDRIMSGSEILDVANLYIKKKRSASNKIRKKRKFYN